MEFLIGRLLEDAMVNTGLLDDAKEAFRALGLPFDKVVHDEPDAALGNGGLGRLAACFMESLATLGTPAYGYGIRYEHGLFRQSFENGRQIEAPEDWLVQRHVWEFERPEAKFEIGFGGHVHETGSPRRLAPRRNRSSRRPTTRPSIGWQARWANTLRLWGALPTKLFDLERFNRGDYAAAAEPEALARTISRVLYPDDTTDGGKALRLKQEYFFTAASLRDLLRRFETQFDDLRKLPEKVAIQLNDTHPAIAGPELVRLLYDERGLPFDESMEIARRCLSYTNHTLLPEALEKWSGGLMGYLLPRHMQIIHRIDEAHARAHPDRRTAAISYGAVNMGDLAFIMAHRVNGVSALHTDLMKQTVFAELNRLHPDRIVNETNGVTPRRWVLWLQPGPRRAHHRRHRRRLGGRCGTAVEAGTAPRRPGLPRPLRPREAREQGAAVGLAQDHARLRRRPRRDVRHPDQAHPRIQAPASEHPRSHRALAGNPRQPRRRLGAPREDLRGQGRPRLCPGEGDHQARQRRGREDQRRPRDLAVS